MTTGSPAGDEDDALADAEADAEEDVDAELAGAVVGAVVCCTGVEDCLWLGVVAGVVCVTVPRLVPVLGASAVDGRTDAVTGDAVLLAEWDAIVAPVFADPWPPELVSSTATTAATPHRATPTPAAARRRFPNGKPRARSG